MWGIPNVIEVDVMRLSARNQLRGKVTDMTVSDTMVVAEVRFDGTDATVTAAITRISATELGLAVGSDATVVIKSTDVVLGVDI
jgi:molybdopterin-binding protein